MRMDLSILDRDEGKRDEFAKALVDHGGERGLARHLGVSRGRVRRCRSWHQLPPPSTLDTTRGTGARAGVKFNKDLAVATGEILKTHHEHPDDLLEQHGMEADDGWEVTGATLNEWSQALGDGDVVPAAQLKVTAKRIIPLDLYLPQLMGYKPPPPPEPMKPVTSATSPMYLPIFSDGHAPLHEQHLEDAFVRFLDENSHMISEVIYNGDAGDNSPFARHRKTPRTHFTPTQCSQATHEHLARIRAPLPQKVPMKLTCGNHDHWAVQRLREENPQLEDWCLPNDDVPVFNPRRALGLDELNIEYIDPGGGEYFDSLYYPLDDVVVMHGVQSGPTGGAVKEIAGWEGVSVIQGHDHKLGMFVVVRRTRHGEVSYKAISCGTGASRDLGYNHKKDCAQGFVVMVIWPDGTWTPQFAYFNPQTHETTMGTWRYTP